MAVADANETYQIEKRVAVESSSSESIDESEDEFDSSSSS